jgi:precorrin-6Y C5,15-methyltransferase (decarboxylating)
MGLGVAEHAELSANVVDVVNMADVVIASERQFETVLSYMGASNAKRIELPKLSELESLINHFENATIVILASGDPLYYGIGRWFTKYFSSAQLHFYPAVSSIQAACHRLGVALQDIDVLSLHGRPVEKIRTQLKRNKQLLILTDKNSQPQRLAQECLAAGFVESTISVCERLGYEQEKITAWDVAELASADVDFDPLHVSYIQVLGIGGVLPEFPGIPDHHFKTGAEPGKGMISKREVRLAILSLMQVSRDDVVWDIGAGCGGVAVELALWNQRASIYALEFHPERLTYLKHNQQHFGVVQNLQIVEGRAPDALAGLPAPNKVFIGGSDGELQALLEKVWALLPAEGVLVASGVIDSTKQQLQRFARGLLPQQVESVEIGVKRGHLENGDMNYVTKLPVEIFKFVKTVEP